MADPRDGYNRSRSPRTIWGVEEEEESRARDIARVMPAWLNFQSIVTRVGSSTRAVGGAHSQARRYSLGSRGTDGTTASAEERAVLAWQNERAATRALEAEKVWLRAKLVELAEHRNKMDAFHEDVAATRRVFELAQENDDNSELLEMHEATMARYSERLAQLSEEYALISEARYEPTESAP